MTGIIDVLRFLTFQNVIHFFWHDYRGYNILKVIICKRFYTNTAYEQNYENSKDDSESVDLHKDVHVFLEAKTHQNNTNYHASVRI